MAMGNYPTTAAVTSEFTIVRRFLEMEQGGREREGFKMKWYATSEQCKENVRLLVLFFVLLH